MAEFVKFPPKIGNFPDFRLPDRCACVAGEATAQDRRCFSEPLAPRAGQLRRRRVPPIQRRVQRDPPIRRESAEGRQQVGAAFDGTDNNGPSSSSVDLLVLREIVTSVSGVESTSGLTQEQLEAMCGGDCLRQEVYMGTEPRACGTARSMLSYVCRSIRYRQEHAYC